MRRTFVAKEKRVLHNQRRAFSHFLRAEGDNMHPHSLPIRRVHTVRVIYVYAVINVMSLLSHSRWHIPLSARLRREG